MGRDRSRQLLRKHEITFQRTKTWKESNDPQREAKLARIEHVMHHFPQRVFAFDEFGPLTIRPQAGSGWQPKNHPDRLPANYHKLHGVRQFHVCYSVGDDTMFGVIHQQKSSALHKVELCFTPTNASWANPIEAHFGPLRTFVIAGSDHQNHIALGRHLHRYLRWRNANARHPDVLAAQCRERARVRSERQYRWGHPAAKAA